MWRTISRFRRFLAIDWSGAKGARQSGIALALADESGAAPVLLRDIHSREQVLAFLSGALPSDTLVGLDLGIALPFVDCGAYFPAWPDSPPDAHSLWAMIDKLAEAEPNLGAASVVAHPDLGAYFRDGARTGARFGCDGAAHGRGRFRIAEHAQAAMGCRPTSNFNLVGAAQVGKSSLTGMRMLHRLRGQLPVWPIDPVPARGSLVVEIYTSLAAREAGRSAGRAKLRSYADLNAALAVLGSPPVPGEGEIGDHASDALLTAAWMRAVANDERRWTPPAMTASVAQTEGWTFGAF